MSVKVSQLTKIYGSQHAVDNISFEAKKGEVLGFLGPNGAGKTTTMKILTCFIPQSAGKAEVCGFDTEKSSIDVRHHIGYLPEHNPLYKSMYVREYLQFFARVHKIRPAKKRIDEMIEMTGLELEQKKLIGSLSKGYRQRVGLAQAMIHNPDVLILDEPTSGLDPNQLVEIRSLIKQLGKEKTVIFSTHIMQEVQQLCDRVLIINHGKIVADDPIAALQKRVSNKSVVTIELLEKIAVAELKSINGVDEVKKITDRQFQLFAAGDKDIRKDVFEFAVRKKHTLLEMRKEVFSVEDIFQELTFKNK